VRPGGCAPRVEIEYSTSPRHRQHSRLLKGILPAVPHCTELQAVEICWWRLSPVRRCMELWGRGEAFTPNLPVLGTSSCWASQQGFPWRPLFTAREVTAAFYFSGSGAARHPPKGLRLYSNF